MSGRAQLVREFTPPVVWSFVKRRMPSVVRAMGGHYTHIRYSGDYKSFEEARRDAIGYDAPAILKATRDAILKVKNGVHRWERDAMVSDTTDLPWALLSCLLRVAAKRADRSLRVLDFGGSLGSTYFWCRPFLVPDLKLRWTVVEQPAHVAVGRADFENDELRFALTLAEAVEQSMPDVLLVSGVLHFLPDPEAFLRGLGAWKIPHFILDREPLWRHAHHRLTIQHVPPEIYEATYPAWFLSQDRIMDAIKPAYDLLWSAPDSEAWEIDGESVPNFTHFFRLKNDAS